MAPAAAHIDAHTSAAIFWNIYLGAKDRGQPDNQLQRNTHVLNRPEISGRGAIGTFITFARREAKGGPLQGRLRCCYFSWPRRRIELLGAALAGNTQIESLDP